MISRPLISQTYRQRFWEFFIFGFVFITLFLFWLVIGAGVFVAYFTGGLAGLCFTAAWFYWYLYAQAGHKNQPATLSSTAVAPAEPISTLPAVAPAEPIPTLPAVAPAEPISTLPAVATTPIQEAPPLEEIQTPPQEQSEPEHEPEHLEEHFEASAHTLPAVVLQGVTPAEIPEIEAYCVKCHQKQPMYKPRLVELKSGHPALRATCPVCNNGLFRIISLQQEKSWHIEKQDL
ncbi:DUF5679 domain-containing protein [Tengunoibacter tsumagoiensis]|uniref:DUF5679 domain-containing protein n=1 Tax=Tengunoibacter tsumagoiensis TaxID=2014871 RepID=A0A402A6R9_9CHLR|nr:DUF5679 domain-containing protein [Tengunoibacter tsumagoiensis]GCE14837.1 hypothetical protein KTT_46960 [Tengunoibacter tsumagoiensis]